MTKKPLLLPSLRTVHTKLLLLFLCASVGCAVLAKRQLNEQWGTPSVKNRIVSKDTLSNELPEYHRDIQPILDQRCVVCHSCYDAPCQLKLSSYEGMDRGASSLLVYNGTRILADQPTRLFVDAKSTLEWRKRDYYPVLNEREQRPEANKLGSTLYRMLNLKQEHPLPEDNILPDSFDFSLARDQQCSTIENFSEFEDDYPLWGMPYGLPSISAQEFDTFERWIEIGSPVAAIEPLGPDTIALVKKWEAFFNKPDTKTQLVSRYIFEHLFVANLYFNDGAERQFFKMVRSRTPSGEPIDEIASRRPFDHPGIDQFYYRLRAVKTSIADKAHMPYQLDAARIQRWEELFFKPDYQVLKLPDYSPQNSANPFLVFKDIPAKSRFSFMLDEAHYTIMAYIKGPVCRGQVALNVIEDHFWVMFVDPDMEQMLYESDIREDSVANLVLPAAEQSNALPIQIWTKYARLQEKHLKDKLDYIRRRYPEGTEVSLNAIWNGDGDNRNAALTVFRHFDSATVMKGFKGPKPETAWIITYSLLERIHYLLVAGFDVYGNLGHQLNTRLYMDFLRMEGESNFLLLMPEKEAERELLGWYQDAEDNVQEYLAMLRKSGLRQDRINYQSNNIKSELYDKLIDYLGPEIAARNEHGDHLDALRRIKGNALSFMPESSIIQVIDQRGILHPYTLLVNRAHTNVSSLLWEEERLMPEQQTIAVLGGVVGSYPNSFLIVNEKDIAELTEEIAALSSAKDYEAFKDRFGLRRSDPYFWTFSDWLHRWQSVEEPISAGILDYNRLENR